MLKPFQISNLGLKKMKQGLSPGMDLNNIEVSLSRRRWRTSTLSSMLFTNGIELGAFVFEFCIGTNLCNRHTAALIMFQGALKTKSQDATFATLHQCSAQDKVARQSRFLEIADFLEAIPTGRFTYSEAWIEAPCKSWICKQYDKCVTIGCTRQAAVGSSLCACVVEKKMQAEPLHQLEKLRCLECYRK